MSLPREHVDEPKAEQSEIAALQESPKNGKIQSEKPGSAQTEAPFHRLQTWTDCYQQIIEKCDVWTAVLKIPQ